MFKVELTADRDIKDDIDSRLEGSMHVWGSEAAKALRGGNSYWPVRSGRSKAAFRMQATKKRVQISNRYGYAAFVNNRKKYKSGKANPNYRAVERTIIRNQQAIDDAVNRRLESNG